jgi:Na+-transporting NADH:ubiquinone oxidoreductase subunit NqrB
MLLSEIQKIKSTDKELREFGFVVGGVLIVYAALLAWRHGVWNFWIAGIGAALVVLGLVFPPVLKPLQKIWMAAALAMGWVMSRVILMGIFFVILTPLALILRVQGKKFLQKRTSALIEKSYWNLRGAETNDPQRCERQY